MCYVQKPDFSVFYVFFLPDFRQTNQLPQIATHKNSYNSIPDLGNPFNHLR